MIQIEWDVHISDNLKIINKNDNFLIDGFAGIQ